MMPATEQLAAAMPTFSRDIARADQAGGHGSTMIFGARGNQPDDWKKDQGCFEDVSEAGFIETKTRVR